MLYLIILNILWKSLRIAFMPTYSSVINIYVVLLYILRIVLSDGDSCVYVCIQWCVYTHTHTHTHTHMVAKPCLTLATLWTAACWALRSMDFSGKNTGVGLPFPSPGDLPDPGIEPGSPALQADSLPTELRGKPI